MMKEICSKDSCTGCAACVNACPRSCIIMQEDKWGYINPVVDDSLCTNCGLCVKVCPSNKTTIDSFVPHKCYAAWSLDAEDRATSTSGGVASVLSSAVISAGGVVYGAVVSKGANIHHTRIDNANELYRLKGSKYVQSHIGDVYKAVLKDLKQNLVVLFLGTPCQIAGLKGFLKKSYSNLITIDIICHGVPNQQLLHDHLAEKVDVKSIDKVLFRGRNGYELSAISNKEVVYKREMLKDTYLTGFMYGLFFRPSCYQCKYAGNLRISDLTIGDFWGLGIKSPFNYPKEKVSVILVNTSDGANLLSKCSDSLFLVERTIEEAVKGNSQLQSPAKKHEFYDLFRKIYPKWGYKCSVRICLMKFYTKNFVYRMMMKFSFFRKLYNK